MPRAWDGSILRRAREDAGMKIVDVAYLCAHHYGVLIGPEYISSLETNAKVPSAHRLRLLACVLRLEVEDLWPKEKGPPP